MPDARNILNVTFKDAVEKIRGKLRSEMIVRFSYRNTENKKIAVKSIKASALYKDWCGDCDICPPNDTKIHHLHILINPLCTALDVNDDVSFGELMDALEEVTKSKKFDS